MNVFLRIEGCVMSNSEEPAALLRLLLGTTIQSLSVVTLEIDVAKAVSWPLRGVVLADLSVELVSDSGVNLSFSWDVGDLTTREPDSPFYGVEMLTVARTTTSRDQGAPRVDISNVLAKLTAEIVSIDMLLYHCPVTVDAPWGCRLVFADGSVAVIALGDIADDDTHIRSSWDTLVLIVDPELAEQYIEDFSASVPVSTVSIGGD